MFECIFYPVIVLGTRNLMVIIDRYGPCPSRTCSLRKTDKSNHHANKCRLTTVISVMKDKYIVF